MKHHYLLSELESAINYWRSRFPSQGEELSLCPQASALAEPYALLIYEAHNQIAAQALSDKALEAMQEWEAATAQR